MAEILTLLTLHPTVHRLLARSQPLHLSLPSQTFRPFHKFHTQTPQQCKSERIAVRIIHKMAIAPRAPDTLCNQKKLPLIEGPLANFGAWLGGSCGICGWWKADPP